MTQVSTDEAQVTIEVGNAPLASELAACITDVTIEQSLDHADQLSMRIGTWDVDHDRATWIDDPSLDPGTSIAVSLGYGKAMQRMFTGDVVGYDLELRNTERPVVVVHAYNKLHRLGRGRPAPSKPKPNATYGDLVSEIAKRYSLTAKVESGNADKQNANVKQTESDLKFVTDLASEIGYEVFVDGDVLVFRKQVPKKDAAVTLDGTDLVELTGHLDAASQIGDVVGSAFDHDKNDPIPYTATNPDSYDKAFGGSAVHGAHPSLVDTREQLTPRVDAELLRIRQLYRNATLTCFGRTDVKVGASVEIKKVSKRFDGVYQVTAARHTFTQGAGFRTRLTLKGTRS
jgi:phage protein D